MAPGDGSFDGLRPADPAILLALQPKSHISEFEPESWTGVKPTRGPASSKYCLKAVSQNFTCVTGIQKPGNGEGRTRGPL